MLQVGRAQGDPATQMWAYLWRIDTHLEIGDLPAVVADLRPLQAFVERVRGPIARWHLVKTRATLAQAQGRFADALRLADEATEALAATGHPSAMPTWFSLRALVGRHVGYQAVGVRADFRDIGADRLSIFDAVGLAGVYAELGQRDEAVRRYRLAGPIGRWPVAPFFEIVAYGLAITAAIALDERDDLAVLHRKLTPYRGRHVVVTAGSATYGGPVELALGMAASCLGRHDEAVADLESAAAICDGNGAAGFAAEARYQLAAALVARGGSGDRPRARHLLARAREECTALGADRITGLIDRLTAALDERPASPLTRREAEVAGLVARGMTNRQIAAELVLSERTVETHVQNTLNKLGFGNRSQIAVWVASRG
jgi:DNA-binding CsgD family transcriptional regulator